MSSIFILKGALPTANSQIDEDDLPSDIPTIPDEANVETCLALNRAYQDLLLNNLQRIESSLAENRNKQVI